MVDTISNYRPPKQDTTKLASIGDIDNFGNESHPDPSDQGPDECICVPGRSILQRPSSRRDELLPQIESRAKMSQPATPNDLWCADYKGEFMPADDGQTPYERLLAKTRAGQSPTS